MTCTIFRDYVMYTTWMDAEWFGMPVDTEMRTVIQERKHHIATVLRVKPTYQEWGMLEK